MGSEIQTWVNTVLMETNSVILPEPRWHGFLENLV